MADGTIPPLQNPAYAGGGGPGPARGELDQRIMDLLGGRGAAGLPENVAPPQAQPAQAQQRPQMRSMDWRLRAAELMRREMVNRSGEESQPAWMRQRS